MSNKIDKFNSNLNKISISINTDRYGDIIDVAIVFMEKSKASSIILLSDSFDEDDDELPIKIFNEECDSRFVDDPDIIECITMCTDPNLICAQIVDILDRYVENEDFPEFDYILYIDNLRSSSNFNISLKDTICDSLTDSDCDYSPTAFSDIFGDTKLETLLNNCNINHSYSSDSALSAAIWYSLAFDIIAQAN